MGNPSGAGFTSKFLSLDRLNCEGSVPFEHLYNLATLNYIPVKLKKVPDFKRLATFTIDRLEFDGFTMDFQVSKNKKLNINEMTKEFALGEVRTSLKAKGVDLDQIKFPNTLEVQVIRARNLIAMDSNGLSDPYFVLRLRKEKHTSPTVCGTLNPMFSPKTYRFNVSDPSAVLHLQLWDEDFPKTSDFIGQWLITIKWLLIDPKHCKYVEFEKLNEKDEAEGWVGYWVPLLDQGFRGSGNRGDVHIRIRWIYDPYQLPDSYVSKPLDQITENQKETRLRIGDLEHLFYILNHVPILLKIGVVIVRGAKLSVKDLFFSKKSTLAPSSNKPWERVSTRVRSPSTQLNSPLSASSMDNIDEGFEEVDPSKSQESGKAQRESSAGESTTENALDDIDNDNEEQEYEENGRTFVKLSLIEWKRQFSPRHGDEGLPIYKVLDRFFRGLAPKLAANRKLHYKMFSSTGSAFLYFGQEIIKGDFHLYENISQMIYGVGRMVQDKTTFATEKFHITFRSHDQDISKDIDNDDPNSYLPFRRVSAYDEDFLKTTIFSGTLEALWEGRRTTFVFVFTGKEKWKVWKVEIKAKSIFYRKPISGKPKWHVLSLANLVDISSTGREVLLKFRGDIFLRLRLPGNILEPGLQTWIRWFQWIANKGEGDFPA